MSSLRVGNTNFWVFEGNNPSEIYMDALLNLDVHGKVLSPRGKTTKYFHPAVVVFKEPTKQVTFLKGRRINPFFQLAESLWILSGRADVAFLTQFNANMAQFSDDGINFNAPYGERLRSYNKSELNQFILNPVDQLLDVYKKLTADRATRQAVAIIYNPMFDSAVYSVESKGKDTPCNLTLLFSIHEDKLDLTVFNRSNDLHWGLFGANLCQFTFIQMTVAAWLGVECGQYIQESNNLHIYLDDYGSDCTQKIYDANGITDIGGAAVELGKVPEWDIFEAEVKAEAISMPTSIDMFNRDLSAFWGVCSPMLMGISDMDTDDIFATAQQCLSSGYVKDVFLASAAYRYHKDGKLGSALRLIGSMYDTYWKVACFDFLYPTVSKKGDDGAKLLFTQHMQSMAEKLTGDAGHTAFNRWKV